MLEDVPTDLPLLIAGPTASGKSAMALALAERDGREIINADALQVFENWRILTARPSPEEEARVPHVLYGHIAGHAPYSVGDWLRDLAPFLRKEPAPVIVGGTGLYFTALTEGLADIPTVPDDIRARATDLLAQGGLGALLDELDPLTRVRIDTANPVRVQRAWEVLQATGEGLAVWQDRPIAPLLPRDRCHAMVIDAPRDWLTPRIEQRFGVMLAQGALDEARANASTWNPQWPSAKAIGAQDLIAYLNAEISLDEARDRAVIATRQYAKRQRTWLRARMRGWHWIPAEEIVAH
ncbi:MAG: tRNA (adenosine(37)-N6)-dimethylallyltransferase MiaA [Pseudomonadota bacterium]